MDAIAVVDPNVASSEVDGGQPVPRGAYAPAIIVVFTDDVSNWGPEPLEAAQLAMDRGVRVYTIGFGTENDAAPFGGPACKFNYQFGGGFRRGIDEETLKQVSAMAGGEYYAAASANELQTVFQNLPTSLITRHETTELSVVFAALGALLAALAMMLSQLWSPLP